MVSQQKLKTSLIVTLKIDDLPEGGWHASESHLEEGGAVENPPIIAHTVPSLCNKIGKRVKALIQEALAGEHG